MRTTIVPRDDESYTVTDWRGADHYVSDVRETSEQLMAMDSYRLRMEAELYFYDYMLVSRIISDEQDYCQHFRSLFSAFMRGELPFLVDTEPKDPTFSQTLDDFHSATMNTSLSQHLYVHCQSRIIAFFLKVGLLNGATPCEAELQYADLGYGDFLRRLSTGSISHAVDQEGPSLSVLPDSKFHTSLELPISTRRESTRIRAAGII